MTCVSAAGPQARAHRNQRFPWPLGAPHHNESWPASACRLHARVRQPMRRGSR